MMWEMKTSALTFIKTRSGKIINMDKIICIQPSVGAYMATFDDGRIDRIIGADDYEDICEVLFEEKKS